MLARPPHDNLGSPGHGAMQLSFESLWVSADSSLLHLHSLYICVSYNVGDRDMNYLVVMIDD